MANVTLMTTEQLRSLLERVDGDAPQSQFLALELILLSSHLKQTGQIEFMSTWYTQIFDSLVNDGVLDEEGNIIVSILELFHEELSGGLTTYSRVRNEEDE